MKSMIRWGVVAAALCALIGTSSPAQALNATVPLPASGCLGGKIKCAIKKKACLLGLYKKSFSPDPLAIAKCKDKFETDPETPGKGCFDKLDQKLGNDCVSVGDSAVIEAKIDAHVIDLLDELDPAGPSPANKCQNGKVACVLKYNSCVLNNFAKAAKAGGPIADLSKVQKCVDGMNSCISKLETKYPQLSATPCITYGDTFALRNKDDAFIDDLIAELATAQPDMNTQRCSGDTSVTCTSAPGGVVGCGGPLGTCEFYFGSPLPLAAGGVATCVVNRWNGGIAGTFNQGTGFSAGTAQVLAQVFNGISIPTPCPRCVGDDFPNDGSNGGVCAGGTRNGMPCDANGQSPEPSFGSTSLDCPPTAIISSLPVDLTNVTGLNTKSIVATSPNCNGAPGKKCLCGVCSGDATRPCQTTAADCTPFAAGTCGFAFGQPGQPNSCVDNTATGIDESLCAATPDGDGACPDTPVTQHCKLQTFISCTVDADCALLSGDTCGTFPRECFPNYNGVVGNSIVALGSTTDPRNHAGVQTFASTFCVAPTAAPAVNIAAGLPGPGRLTLGGVGSENGTAVACPTTASFLPTFKGGILDTGWTGIAHDAKVLSQGKVTVSVTGCSAGVPDANQSCGTCTYTGPIANPDALP